MTISDLRRVSNRQVGLLFRGLLICKSFGYKSVTQIQVKEKPSYKSKSSEKLSKLMAAQFLHYPDHMTT